MVFFFNKNHFILILLLFVWYNKIQHYNIIIRNYLISNNYYVLTMYVII